MKITPTSLSIVNLLGAENEQYVVPSYQRRYSWKRQQVEELWDDIDFLNLNDTHLFGTIVCLTEEHTAGINHLQLVDGQQRLTTISIFLHCLLSRLKEEGKTDDAAGLERLLTARASRGGPEPKISLDSLDARQYSLHVQGRDIEKVENYRLADAFTFFSEKVQACSSDEVSDILFKLKNQAMIIRLDVSNAKDAFKLFETINNRGLRLSATDIIKNFVLGNAARLGPTHQTLAEEHWTSVVRNLDGVSSEAFFRQYMISTLKRRVTKTQIVSEFQSTFMKTVAEAKSLPDRGWYCGPHQDTDDSEEDDNGDADEHDDDAQSDSEKAKSSEQENDQVTFSEFLVSLVRFSRVYSEIVLASTDRPKLNRHLRNLRLIKSLPSHGFLMTLRAKNCSDAHFEQILSWTEAFLLRRHICHERTNDNETVFAKLCGVDPKEPLEEVRQAFHDYCPSDDKFREEFAAATFPASLIERARYCLEKIELHHQGGYLELIPGDAEIVHVEHIIPQKIKTKKSKSYFGDWPSYLGNGAEKDHPYYVALIGNLTLFSGELNIGASNNPYERKKAAYNSSAIKLTKSLPVEYPDFRFRQVEERSRALADLAVQIWPAI